MFNLFTGKYFADKSYVLVANEAVVVGYRDSRAFLPAVLQRE